MPRMNSLELQARYPDPEFQNAFRELFGLRWLLRNSIFFEGFGEHDCLSEAISLSPTGARWVEAIVAKFAGISQAEMKLGLFLKFFHHELFIDVDQTDGAAVRDFLTDQLRAGNIRYPWAYDRLLYDRFFDMFPNVTDELEHCDVERLLDGTPQGVFQVDKTVVGPFGALDSAEYRLVHPLTSLKLWHCSDPACEQFHTVRLRDWDARVNAVLSFVSRECQDTLGSPSDWQGFFLDLVMPDKEHYDDMKLWHLPFLLADGFSESELRTVLARLISEHSQELRGRFPEQPRFTTKLRGSGGQIAERLNKAECFQLALLLPDHVLVNCVEASIADGAIHVPWAEIRRPNVTSIPGGGFGVTCECSRFGIRTVSLSLGAGIALPRLKRLVKQVYAAGGELDQLEWQVRYASGTTSNEKLNTYLYTKDPINVVRELILASRDRTSQAFEILQYGLFEFPKSEEEEHKLIQKILWRLGFDIGLYPPYATVFEERLQSLVELVSRIGMYDEAAREKVRGVAANFFVSLEQVLDYSLAFSTWALLADHYGGTRFKYDLDAARTFMTSRLNGQPLGSTRTLELAANGRNTLYPLIQGFSVLADLCEAKVEEDAAQTRPESEIPGYHEQTELQLFPFLHKELILDLSEDSRKGVLRMLRQVTASLDRPNICNIRNRIDHNRPDFPDSDEIVEACKAVQQTVNEMMAVGVCPVVYNYTGLSTDQYGRGVAMFEDWRGNRITLGTSSQYLLCGLPFSRRPQIIAPGMRVGEGLEPIRFEFVETSEYTLTWEDYPKHRPRGPVEVHAEDHVASMGRPHETLP